MLVTIIAWIIVGLIAGGLARLIVPGRSNLGCTGTVLLGIVGSFVGGTLGNLLFEEEWDVSSANLLGSILGAIIALLIFQGITNRGRR